MLRKPDHYISYRQPLGTEFHVAILATLSQADIAPMMQSVEPMTLGNMRANGVRTLAVWCGGPDCYRQTILNVDRFGDDVAVPYFGPRMRCEACGHRGADARPNWCERETALAPAKRP